MGKRSKVKNQIPNRVQNEITRSEATQTNALDEASNELQREIENSLSDVILGTGIPGAVQTSQVSQTDTLYANCRWYLVSNMRQVLTELYVEHGLIETVVDVPVDDAFRGGYEIKTAQIAEEEIEDFHSYLEEISINVEIAQAVKWMRLYGGGGLLILTDQDWATPLNIEKIKPGSNLEFHALDMWELFYDKQAAEGYNPALQLEKFDYYNYYGKKVHKSRVIALHGKTPPSFIRPRFRGWGVSVVETLIRSINQYLKANNLSFEVLDEFKLDIFKIAGFNTSLASKTGTSDILRRVALAAQQKNFQNAMTMDMTDDYIQKQLSFTGIAEVMKEIRMQIAADLRMPMTKLFGISASGFNSGEDDIEVYNGMVESEVRAKVKHPIIKVLKLLSQHRYQVIPDDLNIAFRPLRILSATDEETVKTARMARVIQAFDKGFMSGKEATEAINRDNLLPVKVLVQDVERMSEEADGEEE